MVFCGKPSGSCHACRERKTKCDQIPEGCTQCKRAKRSCPGYRKQGDLIFRNESSNVIRKFKAKEARQKQAVSIRTKASASPTSDEDTNAEEASLEVVQQQDTQLDAFSLLAPSIEDRATGFFVANYVLGMNGPSRGHLDYIGEISRIQVLDEGLVCSMKAVGLAGFAHAEHAPSLMKNARYQYMLALNATNAALRDPVEVKKDTTLLAIIILGIFETITGCTKRSLQDWAQHVNGAAAVIKLRGPDQVKTPQGRRMLIQVTSSLMVNCLQRGVPLPQHIQEFMTAAIKEVEKPDAAFVINDIMMHFTTLRASVLSGKLTNPREILRRCLELDGKLLDIVVNVPEGWEYQTIITDVDSDVAFNGRYHVYYDYWIGMIWNALRSLRILINELIRELLLRGFARQPPIFNSTEYTAQFQISTDVMYQHQEEILLSVAQHFNQFPPPRDPSSYKEMTSMPILAYNEMHAPIRMSGGSFLIWPLWHVGVLDITTEEVRQFVVKNLRAIGHTMGIQQANVLAEVVDARSDIEVWKEGDPPHSSPDYAFDIKFD
ncbi:related to negative acting factor [Phialocephala subalpina]|uniref:Related to negative acting factor n=1 Tax=Phialocephala subalpina TaxID=576137 RepID=A0A1L7WZ12_9HELO|nr:related to negative acting factor [Phialocephala subalpina]